MSNNWHYAKGGEKHGPITSAQLKELVTTGQLAPDDLVWREDMKEWRKASTVKGLFPEQRQVTPSTSGTIQTSSTTSAVNPTIPKAVKYTALGCGGAMLLMLICSGLLGIIARTVDPEGFANIQAGKNRDGSERVNPANETFAYDKNGGPLTEAYLPYKPGSQRIMMGGVNMGDHTIVTKAEYTDSGDGIITKRTLKHSTFQGDQIVHLPIVSSDPDIRRVHNGFVEIKDSGWMGSEDSGWEPFVKLGAVVGDSWPGAIAEQTFRFVGFRDRILKGETVRCAVIEETMDGPLPMKIVRLYAVDLGMVSERVYNITDGKEVYQRTLFLEGLRSDESDK